MLWLRALVSDADAYISSSSDSGRPAKREMPSRTNSHFASAVAPGTRLVAAIAPGLTIGFVRPSPLRSIAVSELNARPVLLTPSSRRASSGPKLSQTSAKTNGFATLMIANSTSASPTEKTAPFVETTQMPNWSAGTRASAGYTSDTSPSAVAR